MVPFTIHQTPSGLQAGRAGPAGGWSSAAGRGIPRPARPAEWGSFGRAGVASRKACCPRRRRVRGRRRRSPAGTPPAPSPTRQARVSIGILLGRDCVERHRQDQSREALEQAQHDDDAHINDFPAHWGRFPRNAPPAKPRSPHSISPQLTEFKRTPLRPNPESSRPCDMKGMGRPIRHGN